MLISGVREQLAARAVSLHVTQLAKWKTTVQMAAVGFLLPGTAGFTPGTEFTTLEFGQLLFWLAALLTLITGWDYLRAALRSMNGPAS